MTKFEEWYYGEGERHCDGAFQAWDYQQGEIQEVIERLESYPTCMSCYLKKEESIAATELKDKFTEILKEGLLDE